ncbi:hypothetical protein [Fodinibius sp. SL11]|uniref:hypothetical protein n=1 Tax=Fodinibius sp. SL11 TaxID=3425690 RepID=UPI003F8834C6
MKSLSNIILGVLLSVVVFACTNNQAQNESSSSQEPTLVEVSAIYDAENDRHLFQTDTDTISAGWTTFRFVNKSPMVHFLFFDYLPGSKTSKDLLREVSPIFQESSYLTMEGKNDEAMAVFSKLPDWFNDIIFRGGAGFVSPGKITETTLFMIPGNYAMECYIKTADGTFHWKKGMMRDLHVTTDTTDAMPPQSATIEITTTDEGLDIQGEVTPGKHLVKVNFNEETPALIGRDVHVAKLSETDSLEKIATWMDFNNAKGLVSTAENIAPTTFIGGTQEMPEGNTAYFTLDLVPGRYAWISEQPVNKKTIEAFSVAQQTE